MKFTGKILYVLSKPAPEKLKSELSNIVDELNKTVLVKGVGKPEYGAKIVGYTIVNGNVLVFNVVSGRRVKIHGAALRARKKLAEVLGKKYRIGIRNIVLEDVIIELEGEHKVSLKVPYVKNVEVSNGRTLIYLSTLEESDIKKPIVDRLIKLLYEKEQRLLWGGKAEHWYLVKESGVKRKIPPFREDPNKILEEIGWIKRFSIGQWIYTPPFTYLLNMIKNIFLNEVVKPLGFQEATFPKMYPLEVGLRTGHLRGTINSMLFASLPVSYDIAEFEELIDYMYVTNKAPAEEVGKYVKPPSYFLCFAQCEPFYQFFSKEILSEESLPIKWFDQAGPSFRWEAGGIYGVERVIEFHRVEVVWLGLPEQVIDIRNKLLEKYEYFMDKVLDLEWRWAWVTPWYLEQEGAVVEIKGVEINKPGTIDFEVWLPYKGPREDRKSWLEVGNISIHGTKFTEPFKIKHSKRKTLWTGCSGFGVERWTIAFLAQHGFDPSQWPQKVREYVKRNPMPKSVKAVTYPSTDKGRKKLEEILQYFSKLA